MYVDISAVPYVHAVAKLPSDDANVEKVVRPDPWSRIIVLK